MLQLTSLSYYHLPIASGDLERGRRHDSSEAIVAVLTASGGSGATHNPTATVFLDSQRQNAGGVFLDPWGYQYRIALDTDYDGQVDTYRGVVRRDVAVVSVGLYFLNDASSTNDLIASWE